MAHDSVVRGQVNGIVSVDERVHTVEGVAEVEAMPEFLRWELRPEFGNHIVPTVDLVAQPWRLSVVADDEDHYYALSERMRGTVRLNPRLLAELPLLASGNRPASWPPPSGGGWPRPP